MYDGAFVHGWRTPTPRLHFYDPGWAFPICRSGLRPRSVLWLTTLSIEIEGGSCMHKCSHYNSKLGLHVEACGLSRAHIDTQMRARKGRGCSLCSEHGVQQRHQHDGKADVVIVVAHSVVIIRAVAMYASYLYSLL